MNLIYQLKIFLLFKPTIGHYTIHEPTPKLMIITNMFFKDILVPINPIEIHIITCLLNVSK